MARTDAVGMALGLQVHQIRPEARLEAMQVFGASHTALLEKGGAWHSALTCMMAGSQHPTPVMGANGKLQRKTSGKNRTHFAPASPQL